MRDLHTVPPILRAKRRCLSGTFIAAVGADNEDKQEIDPALLSSGKVVTDSLEQCSKIGDLHHAIAQGLMRKEDACGELAEVVAGRKTGRITEEEIIVFDSTASPLKTPLRPRLYMRKRAQATGTPTLPSPYDLTSWKSIIDFAQQDIVTMALSILIAVAVNYLAAAEPGSAALQLKQTIRCPESKGGSIT